jgi:hypothetical protein
MLDVLRGKASDRKLRLFAVACCRSIWSCLDEETRPAVEVAERFADGQATPEELEAAFVAAWERQKRLRGSHFPEAEIGPEVTRGADRFATSMKAEACWHVAHMTASRCVAALGSKVGGEAARQAAHRETDWGPLYSDEWNAAWDAAAEAASVPAERAEQGRQAVLLRDVFGPLPFRPVPVDPAWLSWSDGTVVRLAEAAYDEWHLPAGTLDPARLAVLADALEEAGCQDAEILGHLRGPGPHVRGCHVVDQLTGRE